MATKNETPPPAPAADAPPPKRKLGKLIIIVVGVLVLLLGIGAAAFFLLSGHDAASDEEVAAADEKPAKKKKDTAKDDRKPAYVPLDPFTVNLVSESGDQYLQISLTLDMENTESIDKSKIYMAKIRNDVMLHLSGKKPSDLASKEGKQTLALELRGLINAILEPGVQRKGAAGPVKEVLFTSMIIQ